MDTLEKVSEFEMEYPAWMGVFPSDRLPGEERRFDQDEEAQSNE